MKKIFAAIITAFLLSAGLVATASSPASAAPCTYPDTCFATGTNAIGLNTKAPRRAKVFTRVTSFGAGRPTGTVSFTFVKANGVAVTRTRVYSGGNNTYGFRGMAPGRYTVIVEFIPADGSPYLGSSDTTTVKIKAPKRRR